MGTRRAAMVAGDITSISRGTRHRFVHRGSGTVVVFGSPSRIKPSRPLSMTSLHLLTYIGNPPIYGINTRGRPGILAPTYHELHVDRSDTFETSVTCSTQLSSCSLVGSMVVTFVSLMCAIQSTIQSTCCSMAWIILARTEGLPGPVIINKLGKPAEAKPRYARGPASHFFKRLKPLRPVMDILSLIHI